VPTKEMPKIYENDKAKNSELRLQQWVRIKNTGAYSGDIGLVENVSENRVWVRLIPRVDLTATASSKSSKKTIMRIP
jgi:hypothetical protein